MENAPQTVAPVDFLVDAARTNFAAFVSAVHRPRFRHSGFSARVCRAVDQFVDDVIAGTRPILVLTAPPQHGKEFVNTTPILTANRGWTTHGDLQIGDVLFRPDGATTPVIATSPECESDMRVTFSDGSVLDTHSRHEWLLHRTWVNGRTAQIFETQEVLKKGIWAGAPGNRGARANFQLPDVQALAGTHTELPVAPYSLGVWLGDGERTSGCVTISGQDVDILDGLRIDGYKLAARWNCNEADWHANYPALRVALQKAGVLCRGMQDPKRIPDAYFTASYAQRLALLAGLIDSDGYVYPPNGRVTFSNTEPELVRDVERLVATFGWRVATSWYEPRMSTSGIQGRARVAQVCFQPDCVVPCRVQRYRDAFKPSAMKRKRAIVNIERGSYGPGKCIQVGHPDGLYLVGDRLIPTHNSSLIARCLPPYLFGRLTGQLDAVRIACASYAHALAQRNRRDAQNIMNEPIYRAIFPHTALSGFTGVDNASDGLEVPGGGWLKGVGIGGPLTGFSVDIGIIDDAVKNAQEALSEVTQIRNRDWYDSVFLTRLQQRSGQVIIGTPWSAQDLLAHVRKLYGDDPNYRLLSFPALNLPDEVGFEPDLPHGALVPHLHDEDKLKSTKRHIGAFWWAAMYQQTPLADFGAIFKRQHVQFYRRADLPQNFQAMCMSVDATFKDGDASDYVAAGVWGKTPDDRVYLIDGRRQQLAFMATAQAIADLKRKHARVNRIYIEEAANGAALIDMLRKHFPGLVGVPPLGSKEARAHAVSWAWENKQVFLPHPDECPWIEQWVAEITSFPDVKNDDTVDCMSIALQQLLLRSPIASLITADVLRMAS